MKLKVLVGMSGPAYTLSPGDEREFPEAEAIRLIGAGYAVAAPEKPEAAAKKAAVETRGA